MGVWTGDWSNHGPADAPTATAWHLELYAAQGGKCMCWDCQCFGARYDEHGRLR